MRSSQTSFFFIALFTLVFGVVLTHSSIPASPTDKLVTIKMSRDPGDAGEIERTFDATKAVTNVDAELGETIQHQTISLHASPGDTREFKVEQQFETSMAIGDEGPHIDLVDWKHYTSGWEEIPKSGENKFLTPEIAEADANRFPEVAAQEIHRAVLKAGGKRWGDLARQCKTAFEGPCYVGVSRISFRISARENGQWKIIHTINFSIPLGC